LDKNFSQGSDWSDFTTDKSILVMKLDDAAEKSGLKSPIFTTKPLRAEGAADAERTFDDFSAKSVGKT